MRDWIPIYLQESAGLDPYTASLASASEPAAGILSTLLLGTNAELPN
jgi:sugar phosphate permease